MLHCSHQYYSDMGRYLEAVKVVLVVTLITYSFEIPPSNGEEETPEYEKKMSCMSQKIITCGISDAKTPCIERTDPFEKVFEALEDKSEDPESEVNALTDELKKLAPSAKGMCSAALGLHCNRRTKRCGKHCEGDEKSYYAVDELPETTWNWQTQFDCAAFGSEYDKCIVDNTTTFVDQPSSDEDIKKLKCMYKKIVTCGITDNKKRCEVNGYERNDIDIAEEWTKEIFGKSVQEADFTTNCAVEVFIGRLRNVEENYGKKICSISKGLHCSNQRCEEVGTCNTDYCKAVKKIASGSEWTEDYDCKDSVNCWDTTTDENPSMEDLKKIKCLYKKIVTCGMTDDKSQCKRHNDKHKQIDQDILGRSLEEMYTKNTAEEAKKMIEWLETMANDTSKLCSIAEGFDCH